jgi:phage shock protein A
MGLIDRVQRVIRANINSFITKADDPEKLLEAVVLEMQDNLLQMRQAIAQAIATQKRMERQVAHVQSAADEWYSRAQLALQQGNEALAREALTKRQSYQKTAKTCSNQIEQQITVVDRLKKDMRTLELKIAEVKNQKDIYIARARSAQASYQLQEMLRGVSNSNSLNAFERLEEKVLQLEAQTETLSNLNRDHDTTSATAELAAMKEQLLTDTEHIQQSNQ